MDVDAYVQIVRDRLSRAGFREESPPAAAVLKARRREVKLARFGLVETVVAISAPRTRSEPEDLRRFGADVVRSALEGKVKIPRGLGSGLVVYPALLVDEVPTALRSFMTSYAPKHWAIMDLPVVETSSRSLLLPEKTPLWGAAYYRKTRREARDLLAPT